TRRWFGGKARGISALRVQEVVPLPLPGPAWLVTAQVEHLEGDPECYLVPIALAEGERAAEILERHSDSIVARVEDRAGGRRGILYDALVEERFLRTLLESIGRRRRFRGQHGEVSAACAKAYLQLLGTRGASLEPA